MAGRLVAMPLVGAGAVALGLLFRKWKQQQGSNNEHEIHVPRVVISKSGKLEDIESFGDYVGKLSMIRMRRNAHTTSSNITQSRFRL